MVGRDRYSIRPDDTAAGAEPALPHDRSRDDRDSRDPRDSRDGRDGIKAQPLVHRLRDNRPLPRDAKPMMRLVGNDAEPAPRTPTRSRTAPATAPRSTISDPADPRWVLALRTAESLQGTILGPEKRERLVKVGKMMGLTAFDANLVIAIVQDQARRGYAPEYCPAAGEPQLAMVPLPHRQLSETEARTRRIGIICGVISLLVGIEILVLKWIFS